MLRFAIQWAIAATVLLAIVSGALGHRWIVYNIRGDLVEVQRELVDLQIRFIEMQQNDLTRDEMQFQMLYPGWERGMVLKMNQEDGRTSFAWEW